MKLTNRQWERVRQVAANTGHSDVTVGLIVSEFLDTQSAPSERKKTRKSKAKAGNKPAANKATGGAIPPKSEAAK